MSGLSPATVRRLEELEAKPELAASERGELRSMTRSKPTPAERVRVERLLVARQQEDAYQRGLRRGMSAGGTAYTGTHER